MFCEKCGMEIQSDWTNCPKCGARIKDSVVLQKNVKSDTTEENNKTSETKYSFGDWIRFRLMLAGIGVILIVICVLLVGISG